MFLAKERATLAKFFPGLDEDLIKIPLMERENYNNSTHQANPTIRLFGEFGGPKLLIPAKYGGMQVTPLDALHIQRAIGSRSPSLAVAATMHHFTVAIIQEMMPPDDSGFDLFERVAKDNLFFSSGFAEGRTGSSIFQSHMQVKPVAGGLIISGSKKPCTLSMSMDLMTASVLLPALDGQGEEIALVVIPADSPGIERRPFWKSFALTGTESHEVVLNEVFVPEEYIYNMGSPNRFDKVVARSFIWFELLACAAYLGVSSALVERVFLTKRGIPSERVALATELESVMSALQGLACSIVGNEKHDDLVAQAVFVRLFVQNVIERVAMGAAELLGGMAFVESPEVAYLIASARALAFHPPSRLSAAAGLDKYLSGEPLQIG
ncbi:acyl-CoA/acyl-ACP dehydrogenase (plasmid) [Nostoc sp. UHCC 0926]|uniref:acyl-CoA dehydrogenase family protein n=1 Tax=Nostoc sp. UHCC 0926 TaxID=3025190 RepID=UPI002361234E|nr:acyl-CoA dehydrogenase family protein [Nostoc sp. UHCC 0926]WDD30115.1 acyl-CoA/acyl-ACP dehydrogenase [Nostoc sp. UHCC 0926]